MKASAQDPSRHHQRRSCFNHLRTPIAPELDLTELLLTLQIVAPQSIRLVLAPKDSLHLLLHLSFFVG